MFLLRNKKDINSFRMKKVPYLLLLRMRSCKIYIQNEMIFSFRKRKPDVSHFKYGIDLVLIQNKEFATSLEEYRCSNQLNIKNVSGGTAVVY